MLLPPTAADIHRDAAPPQPLFPLGDQGRRGGYARAGTPVNAVTTGSSA